MSNVIQVKRTSTPSNIPTTTQVALGELAVNTYDGKLFFKKDNGTQSILEVSLTTHNHAGIYQPLDQQLTDVAGLTPTKGNLILGNGTNFISLGIGADNQILTADSTQASGVKWANATASSGPVFTKVLLADVSNSTVTAAKITGLDYTLSTGIYTFKYMIIYQAAALTTGIRFNVNFTGSNTNFLWNQNWVDVSATASTAAADQDAILATGSVVGAFASRTKGTAATRGTTISVDTINSDMLMIIEGTCNITASGNLELYSASEVAAATTVKANSSLVLTKVA